MTVEQSPCAVLRASLNAEEAGIYDLLASVFTAQIDSELELSYAIGKCVDEVKKQIAAKPDLLREDLVELIGKVFERSEESLAIARRVYVRWPKRADFQKLVNKRSPDGGWRFTLSHLVIISQIDKGAQCTAVINYAAENALSVKQLRAYCYEQCPKSFQRKSPGRPLLAPKSVNECLSQIGAQCDELNRRASQAWIGKKFDIQKQVVKLREGDVNEDLLDLLDSRSQGCRNLIDTLTQLADGLDESWAHVNDLLEAAAEAAAEAEKKKQQDMAEVA